MCLRKLAGSIALLAAASVSWAQDTPATVQVAALETAYDGARTPAAETAPAPAVPALRPTKAPTSATSSREAPNAARDIKSLAALVGGLALVGWVQRRRRDA